MDSINKQACQPEMKRTQEWKELTSDQKIERMRDSILSLNDIISGFVRLHEMMRNDMEKLRSHSHNEKGEVVVSIYSNPIAGIVSIDSGCSNLLK